MMSISIWFEEQDPAFVARLTLLFDGKEIATSPNVISFEPAIRLVVLNSAGTYVVRVDAMSSGDGDDAVQVNRHIYELRVRHYLCVPIDGQTALPEQLRSGKPSSLHALCPRDSKGLFEFDVAVAGQVFASVMGALSSQRANAWNLQLFDDHDMLLASADSGSWSVTSFVGAGRYRAVVSGNASWPASLDTSYRLVALFPGPTAQLSTSTLLSSPALSSSSSSSSLSTSTIFTTNVTDQSVVVPPNDDSLQSANMIAIIVYVAVALVPVLCVIVAVLICITKKGV
jgi:hypothetical protein